MTNSHEESMFSFENLSPLPRLDRELLKHLETKGVVDVLIEMRRQDEKWGANRILPALLWNAILGEEVGEVSKAILEEEGLREELVQVAAVALQWIENIDRNRGVRK